MLDVTLVMGDDELVGEDPTDTLGAGEVPKGIDNAFMVSTKSVKISTW